ncbi:MAG: protein kinase [Planctomycetaceae bacterium]|nr:protein kinase [Planctomycetaceae bacterium]
MDAARHTKDERSLSGSGPNRWIWPFELLEQIGEGGMGVVYRARYVVNNREVAVKIVPSDVTDKTALARFERETEILKDLRHPNIVRSFGGVCEDKCRFYAMELVEGGSLEDVIQRRGRLTWEQVVEYALQMCAALECSHRHGIIHRDVKPGNFLVAANGTLKLSDFGLASVAAQRKITQPGKTAGTFLYMAPEQIKGQDITPRTDLYALGCVLFEMLTGRPPFAAETPAATLDRHIRQAPPRVSEIALDCPATLDRLVDQLLEKDPARRPQSAVDVARELRSVSQTVTVMPSRKVAGAQNTVGNRPVEAPVRKAAATPSPDTLLASAPVQSHPRYLAGTAAVAAIAVLICAAAVPAWWTQRKTLERWENTWIQAAANGDDAARVQAIANLASMSDVSARSRAAVIEALNDPSPRIRRVAVEEARRSGAHGNEYIVELWMLHKSDPDDGIRLSAQEAIRDIEMASPKGGSQWPAVVALLAAVIGSAVWYFRMKNAPKPSPAGPRTGGVASR